MSVHKDPKHDNSVHLSLGDVSPGSSKKSQISKLFEPVVDDSAWGLTNITTMIKPRVSSFSQFDDDMIDDDDDKVKEAVHGVYSWIRKRAIAIAVMILSLIATTLVFIFDPNNQIKSSEAIGLWIWTALPGMIIMVYLVSAIIEQIALTLVVKISERQPAWILVIIREELKHYVRLIVFTFALDDFILDWFNFYSGSPVAIQRIESLIRNVLRSVYIVALFLILRNILLNLLEYSVTKRSYRKEIYAMGHQIDTLQRLFCRSTTDQEELQRLWSQSIERKQFMYRVSGIRDQPIKLHLEQKSDGNRLGFSKIDIVEVQTAKDMGNLAALLFDDLAISTHENHACITLPDWRQHFKDIKQSKRAFLALFMSNPNVLSSRIVLKEDFVSAWHKVFKSRSALANQLMAAKNVYYLVQSVSTALFWVIMLFVIARNFGFDVGQVVTAASAFVISFAFATSKTLSRVVEAIMFVFVSHPYQVNDTIKIGGKWYIVESMGILETRVRDSTNLVTRLSNAVLADMEIGNVVYSNHHHIVSIVTIGIALDTRLEQLEQLRAALTRYTMQHPQSWKPGRVTLSQNGITSNGKIELEIRVESTVEWTDQQAYKPLDFALKSFVFSTLMSLNLNWAMSTQPVVILEGKPRNSAAAS